MLMMVLVLMMLIIITPKRLEDDLVYWRGWLNDDHSLSIFFWSWRASTGANAHSGREEITCVYQRGSHRRVAS